MIRQRETYSHGNDQGCYTLISDWLVECASRHPHCRAPKHLALPSRLLDVGDQGTNSIFRLVSSEGLAGNYLALSYCWGSADNHPPKLLNSNVPMYEAGVPSSFLPRTFQDALQIARGLGCRYIWIDALCIIQDSDSDKAREIAKMKDVFQNSYLTVAVADSPDTDSGILFPRLSADSPEVKVEWRDSVTQQKVTAHLRVDKYGKDGVTAGHSSNAYVSGQLSRRAWTLQERLLPCRVLHYTSDQLVWECQTVRSWESSNFVESVDDSLPEVGDDVRIIKNINLKPMIRIMKELEVWGPDALYRYWYRVLAAYSCRELSYDSDKISGVSGIADLIGQHVQDRLVHGLWMNDIAKGLLWNLRPYPKPRRTTMPAPSWSWASYHGHIFDFFFTDRNREKYEWQGTIDVRHCVNYQFRIASIIDVEIDTRRAGQGELSVTGLCRPAMLRVAEEAEGKAFLCFEGEPDPKLPFACLDEPFILTKNPPRASRYPYLCLQIGTWGRYPPESYILDNGRRTLGLVLTRESETTFCRVGFFWLILPGAVGPSLIHELTYGWTRRELVLV